MLKRLAILLMGLLIGFEGFYAYQVWQLREHNPSTTAFMAERLRVLRAQHPAAAIRQRWVAYEAIGTPIKRAIIAAEDAKFARHYGFDWDGIQRALEKNLEQGEIVAGGSTISQQLAKNLFLSGERSLLRKGQEAVLTVMLEALLGKRRILEIYLNTIEWGDGLFGVEAAARHYFGIKAAALNPDQAARLAAIVPRPRYYHRHGWTPAALQRAATIRTRMDRAELPGDTGAF